LKEGTALSDFFKPDRIIIGVDSKRAKKIIHELYSGIERTNQRLLFTSVINSELIKYASNAMLATRISFMNELSRYCKVVGADVKEIAKGIGMDSRIGPAFLQAGIGYGGSCFPKDLNGLILDAHNKGIDLSILRAVDYVNQDQKELVVPNLEEKLGDLTGKTFAIWGLAFKPKTDDIRAAPSRIVIDGLLAKGVSINAYDPEAMNNMKEKFGDLIYYASSPYDALKDADGVLLLTEWNEFRNFNKKKAKELLKTPFIFDGRNIYNPEELRDAGFDYLGVGRGIIEVEVSKKGQDIYL
jgi:UDPglucose 6-dehydrogenase